MQERRANQLIAQLAERGIVVVGSGPSHIEVNLRELAAKNGTAERGKAALIETLDLLGCDRVDTEPGDIAYLRGGQDVIGHAISRGLESDIAPLKDALTSVSPDELFDGLDKAESFIWNDKSPSPEFMDFLKSGAETDLRHHGIMSGPTGDPYAFLQPTPEPEPPKSPWESDPLPYRSPFDRDEI